MKFRKQMVRTTDGRIMEAWAPVPRRRRISPTVAVALALMVGLMAAAWVSQPHAAPGYSTIPNGWLVGRENSGRTQ